MSAQAIYIRKPIDKTVAASFYDKFLLGLILILLSGLIFLSDDHRYGFAFLQEGLIGLSLLAFIYMVIFKRENLDDIDWYMVALALMVFLVPVIASYLYFGQSISMGAMEERRTLLYFTYFLAIMLLGQRQYSPQDLEKVLMILFWVGLLWSAANSYGLIPKNSANTFSVNQEHFAENYYSDDARFYTRFLNGYILLTLYPFYLIAQAKWKQVIIPVTILVYYMISMNQTRSLGAIIGLTFFFITIIRWKQEKLNLAMLVSVPVIFIMFYMIYYFYAYLFDEPVAFYDMYRNWEFDALFGNAVKDYFIPHGHLSLHFGDRGFREYFGMGINVYTADLGLAGLVYKYGFLYIAMVAVNLIIVFKLYTRYKNHFALILLAIFLAVFIVIPFDDHLSRFAGNFAIIMVLIRLLKNQVAYSGKYVPFIRRERSL